MQSSRPEQGECALVVVWIRYVLKVSRVWHYMVYYIADRHAGMGIKLRQRGNAFDGCAGDGNRVTFELLKLKIKFCGMIYGIVEIVFTIIFIIVYNCSSIILDYHIITDLRYAIWFQNIICICCH